MQSLSNQAVASLLIQKKEVILHRWTEKLQYKLPEAREASYTDLRDSIPQFIDEIASDLTRPSNKEDEDTEQRGREHGKDRSQNTKFSLDQVIYEFFILRDVIFACLDEAGEIPRDCLQKIIKSIDTGIRKSAEEYAAQTTSNEAKYRAEQEVRLRRLGEAVQVARVGFFEWLIPEDILYFSPKMQEDWGVKAGSTLADAMESIHPEDQDRTLKLVMKCIETGAHYFNQYRVERPDGKEIWIQAQGQVTFDENQKPVKFLGTSVDITEEKKFVDSLSRERTDAEEREKGIREIADYMPQIVWTSQPSGEVDWFNERWYEFTGIPRNSEWNGKDSPMHPDDLPKINERWKESVEKKMPYDLEYRVRHKSGSYRWHVARALPVQNENGEIIRWVGTITDIDAQKKLQQELLEEREMRERFVAALTHDLRTPLHAIKFGASIIQKREKGNESVQAAMTRILANVHRAEKMGQDLLDANLLKAGQKIPLTIKSVDLTDLMTRTVEELRMVHGDHFQTKIEPGVSGFWDPEALQRLIENLANNAIKYGDGSLVDIRMEKKEDSVEIGVLNFGNPIGKDDQKKIFDNFRRTTGAIGSGKKGWGIGLGIVKGVVEAHGGSILLESSAKTGTEFKIFLPRDSRKWDLDEKSSS